MAFGGHSPQDFFGPTGCPWVISPTSSQTGRSAPVLPQSIHRHASSQTVRHGTPCQTSAITTPEQRIQKERVSPSGRLNRPNSHDRRSPPSRTRESSGSRSDRNTLRQVRIRGDPGRSPHRDRRQPLGPPEFVFSRYGSPCRTVFEPLSTCHPAGPSFNRAGFAPAGRQTGIRKLRCLPPCGSALPGRTEMFSVCGAETLNQPICFAT
jgi:hypothetical protein